MKAIVISQFGGPEVLQYKDVETPTPARGEVRVRVRGTAVNRADLLQRMGLYPAPPDSPADIPGLEFAGEVDAVGDAVDLQIGDRVFGLRALQCHVGRLGASALELGSRLVYVGHCSRTTCSCGLTQYFSPVVCGRACTTYDDGARSTMKSAPQTLPRPASNALVLIPSRRAPQSVQPGTCLRKSMAAK